MSALDKEIRIKLILDGGQEVVSIMKISTDELQKLYGAALQLNRSPILKQFGRELLDINTSAEEAVSGIMEFIKYNQLSEQEIEDVIRALKEQQGVLGVTTSEYKQHQNAINHLTSAYLQTKVGQTEFTKNSNSARMAVSQFGFALGDAGMIAVDFRMFLLSIGNNFPFVIQGLAGVSKEAKQAGMSFGQYLKSNIDGSMKMVLGANALMLALQVLPVIFNKINESSDKAAKEGMEKFTKELENMTSGQIISNLEKIKQKLKEINDEREREFKIANQPGGTSPAFIGLSVGQKDGKAFDEATEKEKKLSEEEKKILELQKGRKTALELEIKDYDKLIDQVKKGTGAETEILRLRDEQALKQKELNELLLTSEEREKKRTEEIEKQKQKHDEYISKIFEQYELTKKLNELEGKSNVDNIFSTGKIIAEEANHNQTLANKVKLLELQKELVEDLSGLTNAYADAEEENEEKLKEIDNKEKERADEKLEFLNNQAAARSKLLDREYDFKINSITNEIDREKQLLLDKFNEENAETKNQYAMGLLTKEEYERAKYLIEQKYNDESSELAKKSFLEKISLTHQMVSIISDAYNNIYSAIQDNVRSEVSEWKNKEEEKLEAERKAALKNARTQAQREKINEQFDKKRDKLEDEALKKSAERVAIWFRLKQLADLASAYTSTYKAANEALAVPPAPNFPLMWITIGAGVANAAIIAAQKVPGYEKGGILPKGKPGFFEGFETEIITPEKDFAKLHGELVVKTMHFLQSNYRSAGFSSGNNDNDLINAVNELNKNLDNYLKNPPPSRAYLDDREAKKIYNRGNAMRRRSKI